MKWWMTNIFSPTCIRSSCVPSLAPGEERTEPLWMRRKRSWDQDSMRRWPWTDWTEIKKHQFIFWKWKQEKLQTARYQCSNVYTEKGKNQDCKLLCGIVLQLNHRDKTNEKVSPLQDYAKVVGGGFEAAKDEGPFLHESHTHNYPSRV